MFILLDKLYGLINADLIKITLYRLDLMYDAKGLIHDMIEYYSKIKALTIKPKINMQGNWQSECVVHVCLLNYSNILQWRTFIMYLEYWEKKIDSFFLSWRKYGN